MSRFAIIIVCLVASLGAACLDAAEARVEEVSGPQTDTPPSSCPGLYDPVCGANGFTYANPCHAHRARETIAHGGECGVEGDECGGYVGQSCQDGFVCRYELGKFEPPYADAVGVCVPASAE